MMTGPGAGLLHVGMLVVWVPALLAWYALDRRWAAGDGHGRVLLLGGVSALTFLAGLVHLVVLPEHAQESPVFGVFFGLAAAGQLGYSAVVARRPSRQLLQAGVLGELGLLAVWLMSRTVGVPLGPEPWHPEAAGVLDVGCVVAEAVAAALALLLLARSRRGAAVLAPS
jgi:hypothetical protein